MNGFNFFTNYSGKILSTNTDSLVIMAIFAVFAAAIVILANNKKQKSHNKKKKAANHSEFHSHDSKKEAA